MITGGTGSFGSTVLKRFLSSDIEQIRIFSRDEKKQDDIRHELQAKHPEYANKVNSISVLSATSKVSVMQWMVLTSSSMLQH